MSTMEHTVIGPQRGHPNGKALAALWLGFFAMANVTATAALVAFRTDYLVETSNWLFLPFVGLVTGLMAVYLGSIGWIDVRRGITDKRLFEAKFGTMLGALAALLVIFAIIVLIVIGIIAALSIGAAMGDGTLD